jgi:opacity protein-like surface antigen
MRKTILTAVGSALLVAASVQFAAAAERHHVRTDRAVSQQQLDRNANSYAAWPAPAAQSDWGYRYSGGYSAPAGR